MRTDSINISMKSLKITKNTFRSGLRNLTLVKNWSNGRGKTKRVEQYVWVRPYRIIMNASVKICDLFSPLFLLSLLFLLLLQSKKETVTALAG